ncbi:hypothetical protein [Streptomyces cellulosae]|uniref:Type IV secretion protein Rhs n=1 Tax=Streptomyces cellulosae TaxID=1968 RepID=A0ABW7Y8X1_STRCE
MCGTCDHWGHTWDKAGRLDYLTDPAGKKTDFDYDKNDKRTTTVYPGGTTQSVGIDEDGRPKTAKTTSGTATLVDLAYGYANAGKDATKIRARSDNLTKLKTTYQYDTQDRLRYALESDSAGARTASWLYCWDQAGNLTAQDGTASTCPTTATWTYNDDLVHAGTDNSERTKLGSTWFHHTALGRASTTTGGVDTGFIREPAGTLNSMTTGGKSSYYLTDATGNVLGLLDDTGKRTHTYAYGPTGLPRTTPTEAVPQPYRYTGAYLDPINNADPTGLISLQAEAFDQATT